jgi:hypothetical protein
MDLSSVTFSNNAGGNFGVTCPLCRQTFDAAPTDGTYSTIRGRLVKVAEYLAHVDRNELLELRARLERLESERDDRNAVDVLTSIGVEAPGGGWFANQSNRNEIYTVLAIIITIIVVVMGRLDSSMSAQDVELIIREVARNAGQGR